jgi:hypothetical protein
MNGADIIIVISHEMTQMVNTTHNLSVYVIVFKTLKLKETNHDF